MGSVFSLVLAVAACSSAATPSPTVVTSSAGTATPSPIPTAGPTAALTASPTARPTASPRPMTPATFGPGPAMIQARAGHAAVRLGDGRVLIMGGTIPFTGKCQMACIAPATASVEVFNPGTGKFVRNGSLTEPRTDGKALLLNDGRVLVSGGNGQYGSYLNTIELYNPAKGSSVVVKPPADIDKLPGNSTVVLLTDGKVLVVGGSPDNDTSSSNATIIFDPASGAFSKGPLLAEAREGATATLLYDGRVLVVGGYHNVNNYGYPNDNAELIDLSHPVSESSSKPVSLDPASSTQLFDGRVLVAGGGPDASGACLTPNVPEVFDPRTAKFTPVGPMSTPRSGSAAIKIKDGRVLLFSAMDSSCVDKGTVEAFDPDSGTFQVIATGLPKTSGYSATLLDDGRILIAGGTGDPIGMTAATWLLQP
jgi:WD40 repeat protein